MTDQTQRTKPGSIGDLRADATRLTKPETFGDFGLRGSVCAGFTGRFGHTVAQVSASSKELEKEVATQVAANSAGLRSSSAECGRRWL